MHNTWPGDLRLPPVVGDVPAKREPALPVGPDYFAEAILTGRPYPLRAVVTEGNPLMSSADTQKVREAFRRLEFYVYTSLFMEESAYYATSFHRYAAGSRWRTGYMRRDDRAVRRQSQVVPRVGASKPDWEIRTSRRTPRPGMTRITPGFGRTTFPLNGATTARSGRRSSSTPRRWAA